MGWLDRLLGDDHARAAQHPDRESASETAARRDRLARSRSATKAARKGQAWEDTDRAQDQRGRWYRPAR